MAHIRLKNVNKRYGNNWVVKNINLEIEDKEFVVFVGPSGCGKTTTLRMIAGLEEITEGEIFINDRLVNRVPPKDRDIAMVFQSYALYPHMTVFENMAFGLENRKYPKREIHSRVHEVAKLLEISEYLERRPKELSGGQRQRVAMGRAIVRKPQAFLFDEPLSNLDAKLRIQMRVELSKLHRRLGITIIYVTHDQIEAMTLADRIIVMNDGLIMQEGKPLEVYQRPRNVFVAGFIGSPTMNFVQAHVIENNGALYLDSGRFRLKVPENRTGQYQQCIDKEVILGIRPEHVKEYDPNSVDKGIEKIEAIVDVIEPIGSEIILIASSGHEQVTAKLDPHTKVSIQERILLGVDMNEIHIYDKDTGEIV